MGAFLVLYLDASEESRALDVPDGADLLVGRARDAAITADDPRISRHHARIRRTGDAIAIEDLGSRNGTRINGARITGVHALAHGDEIAIGPIVAIVHVTGAARALDPRLAAELDRSVRYGRPLTLGLLRPARVDDLRGALRPMDAVVPLGGSDVLVILPELDRSAGHAALDRLVERARTHAPEVRAAAVLCPLDGATAATLLARLRRELARVRPMKGIRGELADAERSALVAALTAAGGNQARAARELGVSRRAVIYKMEKFGLKALPLTPRGRRVRKSR